MGKNTQIKSMLTYQFKAINKRRRRKKAWLKRTLERDQKQPQCGHGQFLFIRTLTVLILDMLMQFAAH